MRSLLQLCLLLVVIASSGCGKKTLTVATVSTETPVEKSEKLDIPPTPADSSGETPTTEAEAESAPPPPADEPIVDQSSQIAVLSYHDFTEHPSTNKPLVMPQEKFRQQMQAIKDSGVTVISMRDFLAWRRGERNIPDRAIILTFDDGWKSVYTTAFPVLKEFGYPFTVFLYRKYVDVGGRSMTTAQINEMLDYGAEIGSHSTSHTNLSKRGGRTEEQYQEYLRVELVDSKKFFEEKFGVTVSTLAYPFGIYNDASMAVAREAGYEAMFTVAREKVSWDSPAEQMGRYIIHSDDRGNFPLALRFAGSGGLLTGGEVRGIESAYGEKSDEPGAAATSSSEKIATPTTPAHGAVITTRLPLLQIDLSAIQNLDPDSLAITLGGFGTLPHRYDPESKTLRYQLRQPLRDESHVVNVRGTAGGQSWSIGWEFKIDRLAHLLPEEYTQRALTTHESPGEKTAPPSAESPSAPHS